MNVVFKTIRHAGDKLYVLSEISGYDERLPVVLSASTGSGARIPSDTFPYCDVEDSLALQQVLRDGALACHDTSMILLHAKNSAGVRFFVVVLPWLDVARWTLEFNAIDSSGNVIASCRKVLDVLSSNLKSMTTRYTSPQAAALMEDLDGRFIHDRIHVRFVRALEVDERVLVSALIEMPYHEEGNVEIDFLDRRGMPLRLAYSEVEDSISQPADFGGMARRTMVISFYVDAKNPRVCLCATDTQGTVAPGFAMLGEHTFEALIQRFRSRITSAQDDPFYHEWFTAHHRADVPALLEQVSTRFEYAPLFSIVCVLADIPTHHIHALFNSIAQQSYGRWELILVDVEGNYSESAEIKEAFDEERVFVIDVDPSLGYDECFDAGIAAAEGEFLVLMHACDTLAPDMLFECVRMLNEYPDCDVLYTDVDTVDAEGVHSSPEFRPSFSPELLRSCDYLHDLLVVRASTFAEALPAQVTPFSASMYDLALRLTEKARRVCHVPRVLLHRRLATQEAESSRLSLFEQEAGRKALAAHCKRVGIEAEVLTCEVPGCYRVRHVLREAPTVDIVLISGGNGPMLKACVRSLYERVHYENFRVTVVDSYGLSEEAPLLVRALGEEHDTLSVLRWEGPANRGSIANFVAERTQGDFILFLNDDARILTEDPIQTMLGYFQRPDVGVVGAKQLFIDGTIEHAGIIVGGSKGITPLFRFMPSHWRGYLNRAALAQNVSAVTGDCMMVRRSVFDEVGGFGEEYALFYADVDFCLKAREAGYYTVFTPYVELGRSHSVSRIRTRSKKLRIETKREVALLQAAWPRCFVEGDAFHNPNLDPDNSYFALRHVQGGSR